MRVVNNPELFRKNLTDKLHEKIEDVVKKKIKPNISLNLEKGIYNCSLDIATQKKIVKKWDNKLFVNLYLTKYRSILNNITLSLFNKVLNKEIKPHIIAMMTHQELQPERWQKLLELKKIKDENRYTPKIEATTDAYTCRNCKSNKCWHYQLQTRSADEPMTTYVTCLNCSNKWKC
jgi:transcription elongation factor S-II